MAVLALKTPDHQGHKPKFSVPAIRTPEKFEEARQFVQEELSEICPAALTVDCMRTIHAVQAVKDAMDASPFLYKDGAIVAKGFTPRIVH
ncbi:hypothetical protein [Erythrobacter aureus]|uniref:Uncharacterized protein n=1 Tax=Erythrobacter aureus TaxID=2182384 RepID=A0A345YJ35_9SPHN|nr:hypothetical protein [Erythrobacter aureus]AXK43937.1 hypothetical protein DVR09_15900 [Erythrobacter aureus]